MNEHPSTREITRGMFLDFGRKGRFNHFFGGENAYEGAECINCGKPLMLYMTLNTDDPQLVGTFRLRTIPVLYCMRCVLCYTDFSYRVASVDAIEIVFANQGELLWDEWEGSLGVDVFEKRLFSLRAIPSRLQELNNKLNRHEDLSDAETAEYAEMTNTYALPEVGGYPFVDVINQVGGRGFLCQRFEDPECEYCRQRGESRQMYFLASIVNDEKQDIKVAYDDCQIVVFLCTVCECITVTHSAS